MNILMIQPGFPAEIPYFTRGLARMGARVLGIGDQPEGMLPDVAREGLAAYLRVPNLWDEVAVYDALRRWDVPVKLDRVECLWEPGMSLAAGLREKFGLPGMSVAQTELFRDKETMKAALDRAGVRTPRHRRAKSEPQCWAAAEAVGYPLVVKPIAGAGSANTYRVENAEAFKAILPKLRGVSEVSVEEFIEGREYTFDTISADGRVLYYNMAWYRPNVLIGRSEEWVSPQTLTLRDVDAPHLQPGYELGMRVLEALGFKTGFTHMEWFLKPDGEAVFGEIAARPPGGRSVELMNYGCDIDVFNGWAEAVIHKRFTQKVERKYNAVVVFKRAFGQGRIQRIEGLEAIRRQFGSHIVCENLSPLGALRRDWKQTLISDGYLILRHPDLEQTCAMADHVGEHLKIYAA